MPGGTPGDIPKRLNHFGGIAADSLHDRFEGVADGEHAHKSRLVFSEWNEANRGVSAAAVECMGTVSRAIYRRTVPWAYPANPLAAQVISIAVTITNHRA